MKRPPSTSAVKISVAGKRQPDPKTRSPFPVGSSRRLNARAMARIVKANVSTCAWKQESKKLKAGNSLMVVFGGLNTRVEPNQNARLSCDVHHCWVAAKFPKINAIKQLNIPYGMAGNKAGQAFVGSIGVVFLALT